MPTSDHEVRRMVDTARWPVHARYDKETGMRIDPHVSRDPEWAMLVTDLSWWDGKVDFAYTTRHWMLGNKDGYNYGLFHEAFGPELDEAVRRIAV